MNASRAIQHIPEKEREMGTFYESSIIPEELRRKYDVYERLAELGLES